MEGYNDDFVKFVSYVLVFAFISLAWGSLRNDMAKKGVFGKTEQSKIIYSNNNSKQIKPFQNNTASVYRVQ